MATTITIKSNRKADNTYLRWSDVPDAPPAVAQPHRGLGAAVLEQAVRDYRMLMHAGLVVRDRLQDKAWKRRRYSSMEMQDARTLIAFFMDGGWDQLARSLDIHISADKACRELGIIE